MESDSPPSARAPRTSSVLLTEAERNQRVAANVALGNSSLEDGQIEAAIDFYSKALRDSPPDDLVVDISLRRSGAFTKLSDNLRSIPAEVSESSPIYHMEPTQLSRLALQDAKRAGEKAAPNSGHAIAALFCQASALYQLERFNEVQEVCLEGLAIDPFHKGLLQVMKKAATELNGERTGTPAPAGADGAGPSEVQQAGAGAGAGAGAEAGAGSPSPQLGSSPPAQCQPPKRRASRMSSALLTADDADCTLCLKLMYEPVTTPCGHTFCRACLAQSLDHRNRCPMCRTVLFLAPHSLSVTVALKNILEKAYPAEYKKRHEEEASDRAAASLNGTLPLFVMDVVLPRQNLSLNIFEPRYRLMVRRCMEGSRRFGMIGVDPTVPNAACTEVEIVNCEPLPDGRFHLEVVGRRRCFVVSQQDQDGYRLARVRYDAPQPAEAAAEPELARVAGEVNELASGWVEKLEQNWAGQILRCSEFLQRAGPRPPVTDPEALSWWIANLLPVQSAEKYALLSADTTRARLDRELTMLTAAQGRCCIM